MNWIVLTTLGVFCGSIGRVLQKNLMSNEKSNPIAFGFIFQILVAFFSFIFVFLTGVWEFPNLSGLIVNIIIMCVFYALANILLYKAFQNAPASDVSVILTSSTMWSVITAVIVLGERLTLRNIVGILLIIVGVIIIQDIKKGFGMNKYHMYALFSAILYGVAFINDIFIVKQYKSIPSYLVLAFALPAVTILFFQPSAIYRIGVFLKPHKFGKVLVSAFFYSLSAIFVYTAYKMGGQASIISSIQQSSAVFIIILAYLFLNEREKMNKKIIGCILTICGVLLLI